MPYPLSRIIGARTPGFQRVAGSEPEPSSEPLPPRALTQINHCLLQPPASAGSFLDNRKLLQSRHLCPATKDHFDRCVADDWKELRKMSPAARSTQAIRDLQRSIIQSEKETLQPYRLRVFLEMVLPLTLLGLSAAAMGLSQSFRVRAASRDQVSPDDWQQGQQAMLDRIDRRESRCFRDFKKGTCQHLHHSALNPLAPPQDPLELQCQVLSAAAPRLSVAQCLRTFHSKLPDGGPFLWLDEQGDLQTTVLENHSSRLEFLQTLTQQESADDLRSGLTKVVADWNQCHGEGLREIAACRAVAQTRLESLDERILEFVNKQTKSRTADLILWMGLLGFFSSGLLFCWIQGRKTEHEWNSQDGQKARVEGILTLRKLRSLPSVWNRHLTKTLAGPDTLAKLLLTKRFLAVCQFKLAELNQRRDRPDLYHRRFPEALLREQRLPLENLPDLPRTEEDLADYQLPSLTTVLRNTDANGDVDQAYLRSLLLFSDVYRQQWNGMQESGLSYLNLSDSDNEMV